MEAALTENGTGVPTLAKQSLNQVYFYFYRRQLPFRTTDECVPFRQDYPTYAVFL